MALGVQQQARLKEESALRGTHFCFQDVGVGGETQLLGEGNKDNPSENTHFSLQMEEVVGQEQGNPLVENNL